MSDRPIDRFVVPFLGITVVAAILGPNLAIPQAPAAFLFRVMIVALGVGALGYLLMGGRIRFPAAIGIPVGLLAVDDRVGNDVDRLVARTPAPRSAGPRSWR